jgi:hypothetical protein
MKGDHKLNKIEFKFRNFPGTNYFINPDIVLFEGELGKVDHKNMEKLFWAKPIFVPEIDKFNAAKIDRRFMIILHRNYEGLYACGQNAISRSFLGNKSFRTTNVGYNVESGFFAALNMLIKEVKFEYIPLERLTIGNKEVYYYGEKNGCYDEYAVDGNLSDEKFVVYYMRNGI